MLGFSDILYAHDVCGRRTGCVPKDRARGSRVEPYRTAHYSTVQHSTVLRRDDDPPPPFKPPLLYCIKMPQRMSRIREWHLPLVAAADHPPRGLFTPVFTPSESPIQSVTTIYQ